MKITQASMKKQREEEEERFIKAFRISEEQTNPSPKPIPRIDIETADSLDGVIIHGVNVFHLFTRLIQIYSR